jgi:hypothetical protein
MSASVSIQSSDNHLNANSNTINKTPDLNKQSKDPDENIHGYFIPLVMGIVLGIIIVATFYSEEFNKLVTGVASTDQAYELSSEASSRLLASSSSTDTADSAVIAEATVAAKASNEVTTSAAEPAGAGSTSTTPDTSSAETVSGNYANPQLYIATSQEYRAPVTARQNNYAPYAPPMPYGMPEQLQQDYNNTLEERRRAYEEATQARREHMIKMHEYRAAVEKRIEQDRQDMYKRRLETRQQKQRERDELMDRIEQIEKSSVNRPI